MKQLIGLIVLISGFLLAQGTEAGDLVASRAKFLDPTTRLSIEEVVRQPFSPIGLTLHEDYTNAALWLRLTVRAPSQGDRVVLLIRQAYLDEVRLYEPNSGPPSTWPSRATGSQYGSAPSMIQPGRICMDAYDDKIGIAESEGSTHAGDKCPASPSRGINSSLAK